MAIIEISKSSRRTLLGYKRGSLWTSFMMRFVDPFLGRTGFGLSSPKRRLQCTAVEWPNIRFRQRTFSSVLMLVCSISTILLQLQQENAVVDVACFCWLSLCHGLVCACCLSEYIKWACSRVTLQIRRPVSFSSTALSADCPHTTCRKLTMTIMRDHSPVHPLPFIHIFIWS